jgi:hypothetical protein
MEETREEFYLHIQKSPNKSYSKYTGNVILMLVSAVLLR